MKYAIILALIGGLVAPATAEETFHMWNADSTRTNRPESAKPLNEQTLVSRLKDTKKYQRIYRNTSRSALAVNKRAKDKTQ